jgi:formylglycine-generating enzyme required for sulfatase activity
MKDSTNPVREKNKKDEEEVRDMENIYPEEDEDPHRIGRGGGWGNDSDVVQAAGRGYGDSLHRSYYSPPYRYYGFGFRLVKNKGKS